ncbi:hypothetical protein FQN54_007776 [Arachnomyces sp. PD_36]|nr:hypothetical protein FQN54_007776 [Arachnomyces sp. PD_36]
MESSSMISDSSTHNGSAGSEADRRHDPIKSSWFLRNWICLFHLATLGLSAGIIQLSFRGVYYSDPDSESLINDRLKSLQFAAKLHEILMVGSLSAILLHFTKFCLIHSGLPLGLVGAPFRFVSLESLETLIRVGSLDGFGFFAWSVLFCTLLTVLLSPASAIAMVPALDWWDMHDPFAGTHLVAYVNRTKDELWPSTIAPSFDACNMLDLGCPNAGYKDIKWWATGYSNAGLPANITMAEPMGGTGRQLESALDWVGHDYYELGFEQDIEHVNASKTFATTASHWVSMMYGTFWSFIDWHESGDVARAFSPRLRIDEQHLPIYQPGVAVKCAAYPYNEAKERSKPLIAPYPIYNFSREGDSQFWWEIPSPSWNFTQKQDTVNFTWLGLPSWDIDASIGAMFTVPIVSDIEGAPFEDSLLVPCTVQARWITSELSYDPKSDRTIKSSTNTKLQCFLDGGMDCYSPLEFGLPESEQNLIKISPEWAELLNFELPATTEDENERLTAMTQLANLFVRSSPSSVESADSDSDSSSLISYQPRIRNSSLEFMIDQATGDFSTLLGLYLADALSRVSYLDADVNLVYYEDPTTVNTTSLAFQTGYSSKNISISKNEFYSSTAKNNRTEFTFHVQRYGYGYGLRGVTVIFGVATLLAHTGFVFFYLLWYMALEVLFSGGGSPSRWSATSRRWSTVSEMVGLAMSSPQSTPSETTRVGIRENVTGEQHPAAVLVAGAKLGSYSRIRASSVSS